jgi:hypothetical protein
MRTRNFESTESAVANVQARFNQWRQTRKKREAIPDELWSAAVGLAEELSVFKVARALGLNYTSLKNRVNQLSPKVQPEMEASSFIEIPVMNAGNAQPYRVDIHRSDGSQMQIRLPHGAETQLSALVGAFMGSCCAAN